MILLFLTPPFPFHLQFDKKKLPLIELVKRISSKHISVV